MYILTDIMSWFIWIKTKTLKEMINTLLEEIREKVYEWELDKHAYRELYRIKTCKLKTINQYLVYELWLKILYDNQK